MVPDVRYVRFDIQPVRHHFVVRGIHVVRIVFGHIELVQDVPKMFLLSPNMFVSMFSPDIRLVRHVVLDIRLVRDIPVGDVRLVDDVPKKSISFANRNCSCTNLFVMIFLLFVLFVTLLFVLLLIIVDLFLSRFLIINLFVCLIYLIINLYLG